MVCGSLLLFLQYGYRFHFYYIEQLQLFLFTNKYALDTLSYPGGLSLYTARFLVQFFGCPVAGPFVVSVLLTVTGLLIQEVLKKVVPLWSTYLISLLPVVALLIMHTDLNYTLQGTIACLFMLIFLYTYSRIANFRRRMLAGGLFIPVLFLTAGPVTSLFALLSVLWEIAAKNTKWYFALCLCLETVALGVLLHYAGWQGEYRMIFLPDAYYEPLLHSKKIYYAWYAFLFSFVAACLFRKDKLLSDKKETIALGIQFLPLFVFLCWIQVKDERVVRETVKQDYYLRRNQWDEIIKQFPTDQYNSQIVNVLYLALAKKGQMGDKLFSYKPHGPQSILTEWDNSVQQAIALCDIYFHIGDMAVAQKFAFEGMISSLHDGNVRLLQRLIETNLSFGAYPVAEKYINLLDKTLLYGNEAKRYRSFLYNDKAVEQDQILGGKRRSLVGDGLYAVSNNVPNTLEMLANNNPDNELPMQYLIALYLTNKDLKNFRRLLEVYAKTPLWPVLSTSHQEAIIALEQDSPRYWVQNGVSTKVEQRFRAFDNDMNNQQYGFQEKLASRHGDSFWYYLVFTDLKKN